MHIILVHPVPFLSTTLLLPQIKSGCITSSASETGLKCETLAGKKTSTDDSTEYLLRYSTELALAFSCVGERGLGMARKENILVSLVVQMWNMMVDYNNTVILQFCMVRNIKNTFKNIYHILKIN